MYDEKHRQMQLPHNIILEGRSHLSISGVEDVESFDENSVTLYTSQGVLTIRGDNLRVDRLSIEGGELSIEGTVSGLQYLDEQPTTGGFWSRMFR